MGFTIQTKCLAHLHGVWFFHMAMVSCVYLHYIAVLTLLSTGAREGAKMPVHIINRLNDWSAYSSLLILVTNKKVAVYLSRFDGPQKPMYFQIANSKLMLRIQNLI